MATIINNRSNLKTDPIRNFRFLVTFRPQDTANPAFQDDVQLGFTSVGGLSVTTESIPYREGGYNTTVHQVPGQTTFQPLTMQRGVIINTRQNWDWMRQLFATVQGGAAGAQGLNFRCDLDIDVLSHPIPGSADAFDEVDDHVSMRFKVYNAWVTSVAYSDLNAGDNAIFVEQIALVHEGFDVVWATDITPETSASVLDN
jgi:phage tail-like protein